MKYPEQIFPKEIKEAMSAYSDFYQIDRAVIYSTLIATAGQMFSDTSCYFEDYASHPNVFIVNVAEAGSGKSHITDMFTPTIKHFNEICNKNCKEGEHVVTTINNFTSDGATKLIANNQSLGINNRILIYQDEATALFNSFGKYNKGGSGTTSEKEFLKSAFNGIVESQVRVGESRVIKEKCFISLLTSIQPDRVGDVFKNNYDGFCDRFLFAFNDTIRNTFYRKNIPNADKKQIMNDYLISILDNPVTSLVLDITGNVEDDETVSNEDLYIYELNNLFCTIAEEINVSKAEKMKQNFFSFCIILAILNKKTIIDRNVVDGAVELVKYHLYALKRLMKLTEDKDGVIVEEIKYHIKRENNTIATIWNRSRKIQKFFKDKKEFENKMMQLVASGQLKENNGKYTTKE